MPRWSASGLVLLVACQTVSGGSTTVLLSESFETPNIGASTPVCHYCTPPLPGWTNPHHPSYVQIVDEASSDFSTPFGEQALSIFGYRRGPGGTHGGAEYGLSHNLQEGNRYTLTFNAAASGIYGDYVVELTVVNVSSGEQTTLASSSGFVHQKDMSESGTVEYRADWYSPCGEKLLVRILDGDQGDWRNSVIYDNIQLVMDPAPVTEGVGALCPFSIADWLFREDAGTGLRMYNRCGQDDNIMWVEGKSETRNFKGVWEGICKDPADQSLTLNFYDEYGVSAQEITISADPNHVSQGCNVEIIDNSILYPMVLLNSSFEVPDVVTSTEVCHNCWPELADWSNPAHPSYVKVVDETAADWSTPYGEQALTIFGYRRGSGGTHSGAEATLEHALLAGMEYRLSFNVACAGASYGDYVVELCAFNATSGIRTTLASTSGMAYGKNMSDGGELRYRTGVSSPIGQAVVVRLLDADTGDYRNVPVFDNVVLIVDHAGPESGRCIRVTKNFAQRFSARTDCEA